MRWSWRQKAGDKKLRVVPNAFKMFIVACQPVEQRQKITLWKANHSKTFSGSPELGVDKIVVEAGDSAWVE